MAPAGRHRRRPNASEWDVAGHSGAVRVRYKVFGITDGALRPSIRPTHQYRSGVDVGARSQYPVASRCNPAGTQWKVPRSSRNRGPRLHRCQRSPDRQPQGSAFRAPRLHRRSALPDGLHHDGGDRDADRLASDAERIVRNEPCSAASAFEAVRSSDFRPHASGMVEWSITNSTILTWRDALRVLRRDSALSARSLRVLPRLERRADRPKALEPFRLDKPTVGRRGLEGVHRLLRAAHSSASAWATSGERRRRLAASSARSSAVRRGGFALEMSRQAPWWRSRGDRSRGPG